MKTALLIAGLSFSWLGGCTSYRSTARLYAERGSHELAVYYLGGHYRTGESPEARSELAKGIENAARELAARHQDLLERGLAAAALGAATRLEGLYDFARQLGLQEFAAMDGARLARQARVRARDRAIRAVDQAEADGRPARELTARLRRALSLDPHNSELARRYQRVRDSQAVHLALRADCPAPTRRTCRRFLDRLASRLSRERREFTRLVGPSSSLKTAELTATLRVDADDSHWRKSRSGKAEKEIPLKNRFKETRRDSEGNPLTRTVRARYRVFERTTRARVEVQLKISDLREPGKVIFETSRRWTESDRRRYLTWTGDHRALGELARIGTDQTPPADARELVRTSARKLADQLAGAVLESLEGPAR